MDKKDVKIEKMVLNIEGEKVSLTMEQAKKLKGILDELFGKEVIKEVVEKHHYHNDWYYRPYYWQYTSAIGSTQLMGSTECAVNYCSTSIANKALEISL